MRKYYYTHWEGISKITIIIIGGISMTIPFLIDYSLGYQISAIGYVSGIFIPIIGIILGFKFLSRFKPKPKLKIEEAKYNTTPVEFFSPTGMVHQFNLTPPSIQIIIYNRHKYVSGSRIEIKTCFIKDMKTKLTRTIDFPNKFFDIAPMSIYDRLGMHISKLNREHGHTAYISLLIDGKEINLEKELKWV